MRVNPTMEGEGAFQIILLITNYHKKIRFSCPLEFPKAWFAAQYEVSNHPL